MHYTDLIVFLKIPAAISLYSSIRAHVAVRLVPQKEIDQLADELIARHGDDAEEAAYVNEDRAWRYSNRAEQGKWRRVRKELRRRLAASTN